MEKIYIKGISDRRERLISLLFWIFLIVMVFLIFREVTKEEVGESGKIVYDVGGSFGHDFDKSIEKDIIY